MKTRCAIDKQKRASNHDQFRLTPVNGKRTQQSNCRKTENVTEAHEKNARIIFDSQILFNFAEIRMIINCVPCELPFRHVIGQFLNCFHRKHLKKTWVRESHIFLNVVYNKWPLWVFNHRGRNRVDDAMSPFCHPEITTVFLPRERMTQETTLPGAIAFGVSTPAIV